MYKYIDLKLYNWLILRQSEANVVKRNHAIPDSKISNYIIPNKTSQLDECYVDTIDTSGDTRIPKNNTYLILNESHANRWCNL